MGIERHAKVFNNGRSRVVRTPVEFEFEFVGAEVLTRKDGDNIILKPVKTKPNFFEWLVSLEKWDEDFPDLDERQPPPEDVNL